MTAARQAAARLRDSEERYRTLFAESPVSLWEEDFSGIRRHLDRLRALGVTDFDEHFTANPEELADCIESVRVVDVNRATLALYGAETRSQLLAGLDRIIGDDGRDVFRHSIVALARGERSWQSEGTNYTLNGDPIRLALQWSVAPGAERDWSRVLVSATDITERTRVEDALRESEARFERVFRSSPSIMGISRRSDGVYLDVNDVFLRELGFRREEVIGRTATDLGLWISPASREEMIALLLEHGAFYHHDVRLRRRSGAVAGGHVLGGPAEGVRARTACSSRSWTRRRGTGRRRPAARASGCSGHADEQPAGDGVPVLHRPRVDDAVRERGLPRTDRLRARRPGGQPSASRSAA